MLIGVGLNQNCFGRKQSDMPEVKRCKIEGWLRSKHFGINGQIYTNAYLTA